MPTAPTSTVPTSTAPTSTGSASTGPTPQISLVIPAYNEEERLPALLDSVEVARDRVGGGPAVLEVIVADNGSTDRTAEIARARGCRVVRVEKRIIAAVRNGGAAAARGRSLCFVDADSRVHPATFERVERALSSPKVVAGATGVTLERWSLGLAATYALMVPLVLLLRMDTGVVFVRRADFEAVDGYDESRRYAEDVDFLMRLRRLGRSSGRRLARVRGAKAVTSTRKFDEHGDWHWFRMLPWGLWQLVRRREASLERFVEEYWYRR